MKVILLENVIGLGKAGDICVVRDGYARNYLVPQRLAEFATKAKEKYLDRKKQSLVIKAKEMREKALELKKEIESKTYEIFQKAGEEGKLFGTITNHNMVLLFQEQGFNLEKKWIRIERIKNIGEYPVTVRLDDDIQADIILKVKDINQKNAPQQEVTTSIESEEKAEEIK